MKKIVLVIFWGFCVSYLSAAIINIPSDYSTIQEGINVSVTNDTVLVQPGTYAEEINFNGKDITLGSLFLITQDSSYIDSTILTTQTNWNIITFENGESANATLQGFTLQGGVEGAHCENSNPTLSNLIIDENCVGIYIENSSPEILNSIIRFNFNSDDGPGIYCKDNSCPVITNCIISYNYILDETWGSGGGLYCENNCNIKIKNTVIANNGADRSGGGIYCNNSEIVLINSDITYNWINDFGGGIYGVNNARVILINSIVHANHNAEIYFSADETMNDIAVSHSLIQNGADGIATHGNCTISMYDSNINTDPFFIDALNENYQLSDSSLCIGSGIDEVEINGTIYSSPLFDIDGNQRPAPTGSMPDMGAYENALGEPVVAIDEEPNDEHPCLTNSPNPFRYSTTISFYETTNLHEISQINIYNIKGQLVRELRFDTSSLTRLHEVTWHGEDEAGKQVKPGIYFYKLSIEGKTQAVEKCLLVR